MEEKRGKMQIRQINPIPFLCFQLHFNKFMFTFGKPV